MDSWLGLRVGRCLATFYIHQMNRENLCDDTVMITARDVWNGFFKFGLVFFVDQL